MIIKGGSRANAGQLSRYLENQGANDNVEVLELPAYANDLGQAIGDMERVGAMTRAKKTLYHAQVNPETDYSMNASDWHQSADILAKKLGFENQPRVIVLHQKNGRSHAHVVFQRTDTETGRVVSDSWNYLRHEEAARECEQVLGHRRTRSKNRGRSYTREEDRKAKKARRTVKDIRAELTRQYEQAADGTEFRKRLEARGFYLAKGDRRAFSMVDRYEETYNPARMVKSARTSDLKRLLHDQELPDQETLRAQIKLENDAKIEAREEQIEEKFAGEWEKFRAYEKEEMAAANTMDEKQATMEYIREISKQLKKRQAQDRADWQEMERTEKLRQIQREEERIRREMEQKRQQERGRSRGLSL